MSRLCKLISTQEVVVVAGHLDPEMVVNQNLDDDDDDDDDDRSLQTQRMVVGTSSFFCFSVDLSR